MTNDSIASLTDSELLLETARAASVERRSTAELLVLLAEVDTRRLYLGRGYSSFFVYCTQALHLSESAAYARITAARASRSFPAVWTRDGGRCAFIGADGRCAELGFLEFHHVEPFAAGGATVTENLQLRCRAHNAYEATLFEQSSETAMTDRC